MQKENQRIAISKRLLKEGVMRLLKKKHIDNISVSELCAESQINRTTFYRHYQTPHDVLMEVEMDFVREFSAMPVDSSDMENVRQYVRRMCEFLYENRDVVKLFIANNMDQDFMGFFQNLADGFLGSRTVQYKGHPVDADTIRLMSTFFATGGYALIRRWLMEGIEKTPNQMADLILGSLNRDITFT